MVPSLWALASGPSLLAGFHWKAGLGLGPHILCGCGYFRHPRGTASASLCLPQGPRQAAWEQKPRSRGLNLAPASCRLNSTEYGELCEKLRAPIRSAAHVVIRQSLNDLFLDTFASLVDANPAYSVPSSQVGGWVGAGGFPQLDPHRAGPLGGGQ